MTRSSSVAPDAGEHSSLGGRLITGASWMVAMRWSVQALGLANTLVLVRLLSPEDFGLVAMAMIVVAFINAINELGMDMALIRLRVLSDSHYHTAWTLTAFFGALNSAVLVFTAPAVASFYDDPRLEWVLYATAAVPLLNGVANTRLADFRRDLDFAKDFQFNVISRALSLPITIALALYLRSYWALIAGMLVQASMSLIVGYVMRPFRPRVCFKEIRSLLGFSVWVQVRTIGTVLGQRADQLYIGKLLGPRELGGYQVSQEITEMATIQVTLPLGRALLPGYARMLGEPKRLRSAFYRVIEVHVILALALAGGMFAVAGDLVYAILGQQWLGYVPVFEILAWAGGASAIMSSTGPVLVALGEMRAVAISVWARVALSVTGLAVVAALSGGLLAIAVSRLAALVILLVILVAFTVKLIEGRNRDVTLLLVRPALACMAMIGAVRSVQALDFSTPWIRLLFEIPLGALVYLSCLILLWLASGRPDGAMSDILQRVVQVMKNRLLRTKVSRGGG